MISLRTTPYYCKTQGMKRLLMIFNWAWWRFMPGTSISLPWPVGRVVGDVSGPTWDWTLGSGRQIIESADPNDHYRPWLEENVGQQGWDWDWRILNDDIRTNRLQIKFRRGRESLATAALILWA